MCEPSLFSKEAELQILDHRQKAGTQGPQAAERRKQQAARSLGQVELPFIPSVHAVLRGDASACPWGGFPQTVCPAL